MAERCRLRVIAVGSPFGADRIAWDVIETLGAEPLPEGIELVRCVSPVSELAGMMRGAQSVILLDAIAGVPPGIVVRCSGPDLQKRHGALSSHGLSLDLALDLMQAMDDMPPELRIVGLGIGSEADQAGFSLQDAAQDYARTLRSEIESASASLTRRDADAYGEVGA